MRRFDPQVYEKNQANTDDYVTPGGRRDPYFEKFAYDMYQELAENPSALFNFFLENNDIFRKISPEDVNHLYHRWNDRKEFMGWAAVGSVFGMLFYDKVLMPRLMKARGRPIPERRFKLLTFGLKYMVFPFVATRLVDWKMNIEDDFKQMCLKYNFGYDDFNSAMNILERAKLLGLLEELQEKRGEFDFRKLEGDNLNLNR